MSQIDQSWNEFGKWLSAVTGAITGVLCSLVLTGELDWSLWAATGATWGLWIPFLLLSYLLDKP